MVIDVEVKKLLPKNIFRSVHIHYYEDEIRFFFSKTFLFNE